MAEARKTQKSYEIIGITIQGADIDIEEYVSGLTVKKHVRNHEIYFSYRDDGTIWRRSSVTVIETGAFFPAKLQPWGTWKKSQRLPADARADWFGKMIRKFESQGWTVMTRFGDNEEELENEVETHGDVEQAG